MIILAAMKKMDYRANKSGRKLKISWKSISLFLRQFAWKLALNKEMLNRAVGNNSKEKNLTTRT